MLIDTMSPEAILAAMETALGPVHALSGGLIAWEFGRERRAFLAGTRKLSYSAVLHSRSEVPADVQETARDRLLHALRPLLGR